MSDAPEGRGPGGREPFEGHPPPGSEEHADLPDLEPEFVEALQAAEERADSDDGDEDGGPALGGSAAPPAPEQPTEEQEAIPSEPEAPPTAGEDGAGTGGDGAVPGDGDQGSTTVEFSEQDVAEAQQADVSEAQPAPVTEDQEAVAPDAEQPVVAPLPAQTPGIPQKPLAQGDPEPPPKRKKLWLRFLIASVLIILSMASATSASVLLYFGDVAGDLGNLRGVNRQLLPTKGGEPQNILILGSDKRTGVSGFGLSDTTILLRLDPDNNAIALMSIPRDLKTYVPGVGVTKFNAAYSYGGPPLTLRTVKRVTDLPINHVVRVDFLGFVRAVNEINCVYVDVDRRYYHSNLGLPASLQYDEIDVQSGYQKLCGKDALDYVRYRHTDTDLVRAARQHDFLREARQQVPPEDLFFDKREELLNIFTDHTSSDIDDGETMLQVLKLFVSARNAPIKEVHFPAVLHPSFVTASRSSIQEAVDKFLGIEASGGPRGALDLPQSAGNTGIVAEERKRAQANRKAKAEEKAPPTPSPGNDGLVDASYGSKVVAKQVARKSLRKFPVFYPTRLPSGSLYIGAPRFYRFPDPERNSHLAYRIVLQLPQGDYFGVQGVEGWADPPILKDPSETRTIRGRDFLIYLDADRVRRVAWRDGENSYWVSNSLLQTLSNDQMLGIARSIAKLPGERVRRPKNPRR